MATGKRAMRASAGGDAAHGEGAAKTSDLRSEVQEFKRRRILEEARELFFAQGYESTTLDAIAESLNVTKPFLYSYFRNKSEILNAICEIGITESIAAQEEVLATALSPAEKLRLIVERVTTIVIRDQKYVVVYNREEKNLEAAEQKSLIDLRKAFDQRLARLLEEGNASGEFTVDDPRMLAVSISGMLTWVATWYRPRAPYTLTDVVLHMIQTVDRMVGRKSKSK
ncbi:MAG: TetR/AcrR family transcriptional regulator [Steroidobacteraceae bacterium]